MLELRTKIIEILTENKIEFELFEHPAVFTVEEAKIHCAHIPGQGCKNLLLTDGKKYFMAVLPDEKRADMKAIAKHLGVPKLRFADEKAMLHLLNVTPGSVSPLCLLVTKKDVTILFDKELAGKVTFHGGDNTSTLLIELSDLLSLFSKLEIKYSFI